MVHVHITAKESTRFPGKNTLLWHYTEIWLARELLHLNEAADVTVTLRGNALPGVEIPPAWHLLRLEGEPFSHEDDLRCACQAAARQVAETPFEQTVHALLQLSQPLRRPGLLADALALLRSIRAAEDRTSHIVSCNLVRNDSSFRTLRGAFYGRCPHAVTRDMCVDGALYVWTGDPGCIFNRTNAIGIENATPWGTIDIDSPQDLPHALPSIWAEVMGLPLHMPYALGKV